MTSSNVSILDHAGQWETPSSNMTSIEEKSSLSDGDKLEVFYIAEDECEEVLE